MRALLPARSTMVFSKAIQCMSKVGEDLQIEASSEGLVLRTLNMNKSAYFCIRLYDSFFESFTLDSPSTTLRCQVLLKNLLLVFRSLDDVETCEIIFEEPYESLVFLKRVECSGQEQHLLEVEEYDPILAVFSKEGSSVKLQMQAAQTEHLLEKMMTKHEEVTWVFTRQAVALSSRSPANNDEILEKKLLNTNIVLKTMDIDSYEFRSDADAIQATFSFREARAVVGFCSKIRQPIIMHLSGAGQPVIFAVSVLHQLEADFVIASLSPEEENAVYVSGYTSSASAQSVHLGATPAHSTTPASLKRLSSPSVGEEPVLKRARVEESSEGPYWGANMITSTLSGLRSVVGQGVNSDDEE